VINPESTLKRLDEKTFRKLYSKTKGKERDRFQQAEERNGENQGSDTTLKNHDRGAEYIIRRLKRDAPAVAEALARRQRKEGRHDADSLQAEACGVHLGRQAPTPERPARHREDEGGGADRRRVAEVVRTLHRR